MLQDLNNKLMRYKIICKPLLHSITKSTSLCARLKSRLNSVKSPTMSFNLILKLGVLLP